VLIPLDGSQLAEQILEPAIAIAAGAEADVVLLRVIEQFTPDSYVLDSSTRSGLRPGLFEQLQEMDGQKRTRADEYLDQLAARLRSRSLNVQTRVVSHVRPATAILDDASSNCVNLIALATHGSGGLKRLLVGSVADKVVRGATMPVLVYRPVGELVASDQ
jgi:nucleotide-binding universal stress UspA family protein